MTSGGPPERGGGEGQSAQGGQDQPGWGQAPGQAPPGQGAPGQGYGPPGDAQPGYGPPAGGGPPSHAQPGYGPPAGGGMPGYAQPPPGFAPGYAPAPMMAGGFLPQVLQGREFASWGARFGAFLIDLVIYVVGLIILGFILQTFMMAREGEKNGMTLGKQAMGIQVIREDGQPWNAGTALLRGLVIKFLLFYMVGGTFFIPWVLDWLWPLWDERKQALHDKLATSYVVKA